MKNVITILVAIVWVIIVMVTILIEKIIALEIIVHYNYNTSVEHSYLIILKEIYM